MESKKINIILNKQKDFYNTGKTRDLSFRLDILKKLYEIIEVHESEIMTALYKDLKKGETESFTSEIVYVEREIQYIIKYLHKWNRLQKVSTPLINKPGKSYIQHDPYGIALIISPWNYPFGLLFTPLVGAIAAGNCIIAKPSEIAEHTSHLVAWLIQKNFPEEYMAVVQGGPQLTQKLINKNIDYIFFTGSSRVGKLIMQQAGKYLIPVTLELGGKNPCIVDYDIDIEVVVRRIVWGKFFNAGQTCIAPDYLLVHSKIKDIFLERLIATINEFYNGNIKENTDYTHIINKKHFTRLSDLLKGVNIVTGGEKDSDELFISPTVVIEPKHDSLLMQEEIFGPILPVLFYDQLNTEIMKLQKRPKPLILYFFSRDKKKQNTVLMHTSSGSVCLNSIIHSLMSHTLPFGGIGKSGMGQYHGKTSFTTFSHKKSVLKKFFFADMSLFYPPYKGSLKMIKKVFKLLY